MKLFYPVYKSWNRKIKTIKVVLYNGIAKYDNGMSLNVVIVCYYNKVLLLNRIIYKKRKKNTRQITARLAKIYNIFTSFLLFQKYFET